MSLKNDINFYTEALNQGQLQRAYKGIIVFMNDFKAHLEKAHSDFSMSALYPGYMDMTYFAFTPPPLKAKDLKIAVVYLHEENCFEVWLAARNRKLQEKYSDALKNKDTGKYTLCPLSPGVDAIISWALIKAPDFDNQKALYALLEANTLAFIEDMLLILK